MYSFLSHNLFLIFHLVIITHISPPLYFFAARAPVYMYGRIVQNEVIFLPFHWPPHFSLFFVVFCSYWQTLALCSHICMVTYKYLQRSLPHSLQHLLARVPNLGYSAALFVHLPCGWRSTTKTNSRDEGNQGSRFFIYLAENIFSFWNFSSEYFVLFYLPNMVCPLSMTHNLTSLPPPFPPPPSLYIAPSL